MNAIIETMVQRQAREVIERLNREDVPMSLDTYPDLKRRFESVTGSTWAEYLLTPNPTPVTTVIAYLWRTG